MRRILVRPILAKMVAFVFPIILLLQSAGVRKVLKENIAR